MAYIYDPDNKFGYKDTLPPESDEKVIRGTDFDAEFKKIQIGVGDSFDEANAGLEQEIEDRIAGDQNLQDQINNLDNAEIIGDLNAEIQARIEGDQNLQDQIDDLLAQPGAGMVISETEPAEEERVPGLQWLDSTTAEVWIWDGDRWLEFPSTEGPAGPPGADGADGDAYWEAYGPNIYYDKGNVGVGTNDPAAQFEVKGSNTNARFRGAGSQLINFNFSQTPSTSEIDVRNAGDFHISMQGVPALTIDNSNNVGVGTDPAVELHVKGSEIRIDNTGSGSNGYIRFMNDSGAMSVGMSGASANELLTYDRLNGQNASKFVGGASGSWQFMTNGIARLAIDATGDATFSGTARFETLDNPIMLRGSENYYSIGVELINNPTLGNMAMTSHKAWQGHHFRAYDTASGQPVIFVDGDGTFSGTVSSDKLTANKGDFASTTLTYNNGTTTSGISAIIDSTGTYANTLAHTNTGLEFRSNSATRGWLFQNANGTKLTIEPNGNATFTGTVEAAQFTRNGVPVPTTRDLIETLSTLRKATMDETQDIRESLRSAIDELILGFEQKIATMPAPEVSTMEIPE